MDNSSGSVAVTVALILTLLLGVMAFSIDTGYLYLKKNRYQDAVEAAAMAGAIDLCGDDPTATARNIAEENGIADASDETILQVTPGYYDENDVYAEDFSTYVDFEADPDPETAENEAVMKVDGSCCQYNNAVMVLLEKEEQPLTGVLRGDASPILIRTAAVAYLKRYGMVALGDDGITTEGNWASGYPAYQDQIVHSNSQVQFGGTETFSGDTAVTAVDGINGGPGTEGVDAIEIPPVEWEELKQDALENGQVYRPAEWTPTNDLNDSWPIDDQGNEYTRIGSTYFFCPRDGNFDGATYFFEVDDQENPGNLVILNEKSENAARTCRNLTIASEIDTKIGHFMGNSYSVLYLTLGGPGSDVVRLYAKGDIIFRDRYGGNSEVNYQCDGLVIIGEKKVTVRTYTENQIIGLQKLRIIADNVVFRGNNYGSAQGKIIINGLFAPPCPPRFVKMGRLVPVE